MGGYEFNNTLLGGMPLVPNDYFLEMRPLNTERFLGGIKRQYVDWASGRGHAASFFRANDVFKLARSSAGGIFDDVGQFTCNVHANAEIFCGGSCSIQLKWSKCRYECSATMGVSAWKRTFVVYTEARDTLSLRPERTTLLRNRGLAVKLTRLFRF
ncbi:MAG: hypothetical protein Ct9H300mP25_12950 [Acidobacteriota bacterium]|nr:MAG: hypothetical protein Ct9H300mP25_12950 [Acidobacteriota bacterium]